MEKVPFSVWTNYHDICSRKFLKIVFFTTIIILLIFCFLFFQQQLHLTMNTYLFLTILLFMNFFAVFYRIVSSITYRKIQKVYIFTSQTVTIQVNTFDMWNVVLNMLFKKELKVNQEDTNNDEEHQLKYLTSKNINGSLPRFFGYPIYDRLLKITWTYSDRHEKKSIVL